MPFYSRFAIINFKSLLRIHTNICQTDRQFCVERDSKAKKNNFDFTTMNTFIDFIGFSNFFKIVFFIVIFVLFLILKKKKNMGI